MRRDQVRIGTPDAHVEWDRYEGSSVWINNSRFQFHFFRDNYNENRVWPPEWRRTHSECIWEDGHDVSPPRLTEKGIVFWFLHRAMSFTRKVTATK